MIKTLVSNYTMIFITDGLNFDLLTPGVAENRKNFFFASIMRIDDWLFFQHIIDDNKHLADKEIVCCDM